MAARAIDWSFLNVMDYRDVLVVGVLVVVGAGVLLWFLDRVVFRSKYER